MILFHLLVDHVFKIECVGQTKVATFISQLEIKRILVPVGLDMPKQLQKIRLILIRGLLLLK